MARVYAHEDHEYRQGGESFTLKAGEAADIDDDVALALVTEHSEKLVLLADGENLPNKREYATTMKVTPDMDRRMVPGRLSRQKDELLRKAKREGRHYAALTITR